MKKCGYLLRLMISMIKRYGILGNLDKQDKT